MKRVVIEFDSDEDADGFIRSFHAGDVEFWRGDDYLRARAVGRIVEDDHQIDASTS